eukprot:TRINITY_DN22005_c0_g1_i1.p1 TRINITY_DN22005_c0_g1~~TRINITY_DN22005_c0_g1_i1.p1  ORF type:complete len:203 (-),score=37.79 TRINITY_DN22005_c0_g1_i1:136-699(-)
MTDIAPVIPNPKRTVYIGNLDDTVTEQLINAAFIPFGDIVAVNIPIDQYSTKTRGFGFVEFEETDDALAAVDNMHNSELFGKVITCTIAKPNANGSAKSRPVWEDEKLMQELISGEGEDKKKEDNKTTESKVVMNQPKRIKTDVVRKLPPGMARCQTCGGWGKDLVKAHGYCNHCYSRQSTMADPDQ